MKRISRDEMYLRMAEIAALRSTCNRLRVGSIIINDGTVVAEGYNGAPSGLPHCHDVGCIDVEGSCKRTVHAEINAIIKAAKKGNRVEGGTIYCSHSPCVGCASAIINAGITKVVYRKAFRDTRPLEMLGKVGITVVQKEDDEALVYELLT